MTTTTKDGSIQSTLARILRERVGYNERYASQIAEDILKGLQEHFGGDEVYIPKRLPRVVRDRAVREAFTGANRDEICKAFAISRRTFYNIIGRRQ
jgi:Mor family transcriptional regulator